MASSSMTAGKRMMATEVIVLCVCLSYFNYLRPLSVVRKCVTVVKVVGIERVLTGLIVWVAL